MKNMVFQRFYYKKYTLLTLKMRSTKHEDTALIVEQTEKLLYELYQNEDYYKVTSMEAMLETLNSITDTLMIVLGGIAGLIGFGSSLMIGVVFGLFPAYKAAKLNPIEALRAN